MTKDLTSKDNTFSEIRLLFPTTANESRIVLGCRRADYSASKIAHAVEDCNAQVLNLNIVNLDMLDSDDLLVDLRVSHRNTEAIVRSIERYGYDVLDVDTAAAADDDTMRNRANEVLRYLEI